jgi:hypothetical protein
LLKLFPLTKSSKEACELSPHFSNVTFKMGESVMTKAELDKDNTDPTTPASVHCYLLTPWRRVLHEKLKRPELLKKIPAFYGTQRFITAFTRARHLSLS